MECQRSCDEDRNCTAINWSGIERNGTCDLRKCEEPISAAHSVTSATGGYNGYFRMKKGNMHYARVEGKNRMQQEFDRNLELFTWNLTLGITT